MKNIWTKIAASVGVLAASLALGGVTMAAEATNSNTGADSSNTSTVSIENDVTIDSTNNADINNTININANTGGNSANQNTGGGSVSTGDINGSVSIQNSGNENGIFDSVVGINCSSDCDFSASNSNTGADSDNDASVSVSNDVDINVENNANVDNNVDADLNTGGNSADKNTGNGSVKTGDINFDVSIINDLNKNAVGVPVSQPPKGPTPPMPRIVPGAKPEEGAVLGATLPVTGGGAPWYLLILALGVALKLLEKIIKPRLREESV